MSKKPLVKSSVKKQKSSTTKKLIKKSAGKKIAVKKKALPKKKVISEKEREVRAANLIANSEKKKAQTTKRPKKNATTLETTNLLDAIIEGMRERKAKNIAVLNLDGIEHKVTDYFIICDADSNIHVKAIADSIQDTVEKLTKDKLYHIEGQQNAEWILLDYINIVAHVFLRETREYYNIEGLWGDAEITLIND